MPASLSLTSIVQLSDEQIAAPVDDETVILSVQRGSYYGLDSIGTEIWQRLAAPIQVASLCNQIMEKYDADRVTIERDVLALLEKLISEGLVLFSKP